MEVDKETEENIKEVLLNDAYDDNAKLKVLLNLKKKFKPPDKIFSKLKLESLLQCARVSLESKAQDKNFLFKYGTSLVHNIGRNAVMDAEIYHQLEYIFIELGENETLSYMLVTKLCSRLESGTVFNREKILNATKQVIEKTVLDWVDLMEDPQVEFLAKMSSDSPKLFQSITSLFFEVLTRTSAHWKVLEVQKLYVSTVKSICHKEDKNFLGLYPKGCRRLVSLLMVPPKAYAHENEDILNDVVSLLMEMFLANKKKALILLSHYSEWVKVLKFNLEQS